MGRGRARDGARDRSERARTMGRDRRPGLRRGRPAARGLGGWCERRATRTGRHARQPAVPPADREHEQRLSGRFDERREGPHGWTELRAALRPSAPRARSEDRRSARLLRREPQPRARHERRPRAHVVLGPGRPGDRRTGPRGPWRHPGAGTSAGASARTGRG